jgi:hypothetical protein
MSVQKTLLLLVFLFIAGIKPCTNDIYNPPNLNSLTEVVDFLKDPNRQVNYFLSFQDPAKFLFTYYQDAPEKCLEEIFESNYFSLDELFFSVISIQEQVHYLHPTEETFGVVFKIFERIISVVHRKFFQQYQSKEELAKHFSIIKLFFKFANRHANFAAHFCTTKVEERIAKNLISEIGVWEFVTQNLPKFSPNGTIDYAQAFTSFDGILAPTGNTFPKFDENKIGHTFLFAILLNQVIMKKDPELFTIIHPNLPSLIGLIFDCVDDRGESILSCNYHHVIFHYKLRNFFKSKYKLLSLANITKKRKMMEILENGEFEVKGSGTATYQLESPQRDPKVVWQLKGISIIEEFLKSQNFENLPQ